MTNDQQPGYSSTPEQPIQDSQSVSPTLNPGETLHNLAAEIAQVPLKALQQSLLEVTVQPILTLANDILSKEQNDALFGGLTAQVAEIWKPFVEELEEKQKLAAEEIAPYFKEAELWITPSLPWLLWTEARNLHTQGQLTVPILQQLVLDTFRDNTYETLHEMVKNWWDCAAFERRRRFILDALDAHLGGKYTLSVPTLFTIAEGVMREITPGPKKESQALINQVKRDLSDKLPDWSLSALDKDSFLNAYRGFYNETRPSLANRHEMLHGRDLNYDTELNSLRLFLLLDMLHELANLAQGNSS